MKITLSDAEKLEITFEVFHSLIVEMECFYSSEISDKCMDDKDCCQGREGLDDAKRAYALRGHLEEAAKFIALHF